MTARTPQQMRELADRAQQWSDRAGIKHKPGQTLAECAAALRTAADQLEAVLAQVEALRMPFTTGKRLRAIHHNAAIDAVLAILTADTAPQERGND